MRIKMLAFLFLTTGIALTSFVSADPLEPKDFAAFNIQNLNSTNFDTRMMTFRIIKAKGWKKKYKLQIFESIRAMLKSKDVFMQRTGVQGANMLKLGNFYLDGLVAKIGKDIDYKKGNQVGYLRYSIVTYLTRRLVQVHATAQVCKQAISKAAMLPANKCKDFAGRTAAFFYR